jgi:hypothetical protein
MDKLYNEFRSFIINSRQYNVSDDEINYLLPLLQKSTSNLVFTRAQFISFCKSLDSAFPKHKVLFCNCTFISSFKRLAGISSFFVYPKINGIKSIDTVSTYLSLVYISPTFHYYITQYNSNFVDDIVNYCDNYVKNTESKLVLINITNIYSNSISLNCFNAQEATTCIEGGILYDEYSDYPMDSFQAFNDIYNIMGDTTIYYRNNELLEFERS